MSLSLYVKANDTSKVEIYHPKTKEHVGTLIIASPDSEVFKTWRRELNDRRQKRDYKENTDNEIKEALCRRTVGWEGVKDEHGQDVPFSADELPSLYAQSWFVSQVLQAIGEDDFFF